MTIKLVGADDATALGGEGTGMLLLYRFQAEATGNITEFKVKAYGSGHVKVGIYTDSSGSPDSLLNANNNNNAVSAGWNTISIPSTAVTQGTYYWLGVSCNELPSVGYSSVTGGTLKYKTGWNFADMPNPAGTGYTNATDYGLVAGWGALAGGPAARSLACIIG